MGMSWDNHMPGLVLTNPPKDQEDPEVKALEQRLAAAGWTVVDKRVGEDVAVMVRRWGLAWMGHVAVKQTFRGPTTVAALTEACEAVGA